ncbi:hypothetical protein FIBSPDRAFT_855711 [Athelia psychrophila]|uniref:Magnesium transporter n=1 Tax=Athelia psychrophila TaxID=1759441 RepID=A0A166NYZ4_9AGAM|nr:hypothetical protein FIBSPDRAFT_855711 [Fibularhizoctonia sp. CBS 109695]
MLAQLLLILATAALLHAAFSTYEHLSLLKSLGRPAGALPADIVLESLGALALGILGSSLNAPSLRDISWQAEMRTRTIDEVDARPGFTGFVHRGNTLAPRAKA